MSDKGSGCCDKKPKKCCKVKCPKVCVKQCADVCYTSYFSSGPNVLQPVQLPSQIDTEGEVQNIDYLPIELCGASCYRVPYNVSNGSQFSFVGGAWTTAFQCATVDSCNFKRDGNSVEVLKSGDYNLALAFQPNVTVAAIEEAKKLIERYAAAAESQGTLISPSGGLDYGVRSSIVALPPCSKVGYEIPSSVRAINAPKGADEEGFFQELAPVYLSGLVTFPNVDTIVSLCAGTRLIVLLSVYANANQTAGSEPRSVSRDSVGAFTSKSYGVCPAVRPVVVELTLKRLGGISKVQECTDRS